MGAKSKISKVFVEEGQYSYEVLLKISGKFLIKNNLVTEWSNLRGVDEKKILEKDFSDSITLLQAKHLGVLEII